MLYTIHTVYYIFSTQITTLDVSWNPDMTVDCYTALGEIVRQCHVQNLYMEGCRLDTKKLESFKMSVKDAQVRTVILKRWRLAACASKYCFNCMLYNEAWQSSQQRIDISRNASIICIFM